MPAVTDIAYMVGNQAVARPALPRVDLTGKTFIVTGSNTGIGFETVKHLIGLKASKVILGCRNMEKGEAARKLLLKQTNTSAELLVWQVDLASSKSVLAFCSQANSELERLDGFVANAAVELMEYHDAEGIEQNVKVNVVETMTMAVALFPLLQKTAQLFRTKTNLTVVGSLYHVMAPDDQLDAPKDQDIISALSNPDTADMVQRYALTKVMIHLCTAQFSSRVDASQNVVVNWVNPGWCYSELSRHKSDPWSVRTMQSMIGWTSEQGSRAVTWAAVSGKGMHGHYVSEGRVKKESQFVRSEKGREISERLWKDVVRRMRGASPELSIPA